MSEPFGARLPLSHCTDCGTELNGAFDTRAGHHVPKEGDLSVCIQCGNPMVYRADQTLRAMTALEWAVLKREQRMEVEHAQAQVAKAQRNTPPKPPAPRKKSRPKH